MDTSGNKAEKISERVKLGFTLYGFSNPDTTIFAGPEGSIVFYGAGLPIYQDKYILVPIASVAMYSGVGIIPSIERKQYPKIEPIDQKILDDEASGPTRHKRYFIFPRPSDLKSIKISSLSVNNNEIQNIIFDGKIIRFNRLGRSVEINCDKIPSEDCFILVAEWSYTYLHIWVSWVNEDKQETVFENKIVFPIALYPDLFLQMVLGSDSRHAANVKLPESSYDQPREDIPSHLLRLRIFVNELAELASLFDKRIEEVNKRENKIFADLGWPQPVVLLRQLGGEMADIQLNLYFKSFLFVARQVIDKILKLLFLARDRFEIKKAKYKICDGSRPENFPKFAQGVIEDKYEYDSELLSLVKENLHLLAVARALRNNLKTQGTFNVTLLNGEASIVVHILDQDKKDKSYGLFVGSPLVEMIGKSLVKVKPKLMNDVVNFASKFGQAFEKKLENAQ